MRLALGQFKDEIINIRSFNQMSKVDLAREERVSKCDKVIESFRSILTMEKVQSIIDRKKEEVSDSARKL